MKARRANNGALLLGLFCICQAVALPGQSLLSNGDFDAGNTGFTSDYIHAPGDISPPGTYDVVRNPRESHALGASLTDHTSGTGFMLAVNGADVSGLVVWRQSVWVTMNTAYEFSGWAASWGDDGTGHDLNPARFRISINGSVVGPAFQLSNLDGQWQSFGVPWNSTASDSALIELRLETTDFLGNDPAFDDFQFSAVPEPGMLSLLSCAAVAGLLLRGFRRRRRTCRPIAIRKKQRIA